MCAFGDRDAIDQDTIHRLFPGLDELLSTQRNFPLDCESQYTLPWEEQRWGKCMTVNVCHSEHWLWCRSFSRTVQEANFAVYEPLWANYDSALELASLVELRLKV